MGVALWRQSSPDADRRAVPDYVPPPQPGCLYRIETFGEPRSTWRTSPAEAMADAIALDLASWDEVRQQHFLAVPVDMRVRRPEPRS